MQGLLCRHALLRSFSHPGSVCGACPGSCPRHAGALHLRCVVLRAAAAAAAAGAAKSRPSTARAAPSRAATCEDTTHVENSPCHACHPREGMQDLASVPISKQ